MHDQLYWLRQGRSSVNDNALLFHTLAAVSGWKETVLITAFRQGLNPNIHQQMVIYDDLAVTYCMLPGPTHATSSVHLYICRPSSTRVLFSSSPRSVNPGKTAGPVATSVTAPPP